MNDSSTQKPEFPSDVVAQLQSVAGVDISHDRRFGHELFVDTGTESGGYTDRVSARPFDLNFQLLIEGSVVIPVILSRCRQDIRSAILRCLSGQGKKAERYTGMPRNFGSGDKEVQFLKPMHETTSGRGVLVIPASEIVAELYKGATEFRAGIARILELPKKPPVYRKRKFLRPMGYESIWQETVEDRRTPETSANGHLAPELRVILEAMGEIVYESDPTGTDRVVICFKNRHGLPGDEFLLRLFDSVEGEKYPAHNQALAGGQLSILNTVGADDVRFFLETFPLAFANAEDGDRQSLLRSASLSETAECAQQNGRWDQYTVDTLLLACAQRGCLDNLYGDGRWENHVQMQELKDTRNRQMDELGMHVGQVGVASAIAELKEQEKRQTLDYPQRVTVMQMAEHLEASCTGVLTYGGGHFSSGTMFEDYSSDFESYLQFLPKTQIIVVEQHDYDSIGRLYYRLFAAVGTLPPEHQLRFHQLYQIHNALVGHINVARNRIAAEPQSPEAATWQRFAEDCGADLLKVRQMLAEMIIFLRTQESAS